MSTGTEIVGTEAYFDGMEDEGPTHAMVFSWIMSVAFMMGEPRPGMRREAFMPWSFVAVEGWWGCEDWVGGSMPMANL